jgi:LacI family transcriptional regulator
MQRVLFLAPEITPSINELYYTVAERARERGAAWVFRACENREEYHAQMRRFAPELLITVVEDAQIPAFLAKIPRVTMGSSVIDSGDFRVDESAIGRAAAAHLTGCGYRELALLGREGDPVTEARLRAFGDHARDADLSLHLRRIDYSPAPWLRTNPNPGSGQRLRQWLTDLPKPVGVFCMSPMQAAGVQMLCQELGLSVPDAVGIVSVGGRTDAIQSMRPGISVLSLPLHRIGHGMADRALALLAGKPRPAATRIQPDEVIERGSTAIHYASDPVISRTVRFIAEHLDAPLKVGDLASRAGISRSGFEQRFRAATGRSPLAEIHRQRVKRAQALLHETGLAVKEVADRCGIRDAYQFSAFFKKQTGLSPRQFREQLGM